MFNFKRWFFKLKPKLSDENKNNFKTLATYLLNLKDTSSFDMGRFSCGTFDGTCGSLGCAVGHATRCIRKIKTTETWCEFQKSLFGVNTHLDVNIQNRVAWVWCFSNNWKGTDNSPYGAARRILWMLKNGVPGDWNEQMNGRADLCY